LEQIVYISTARFDPDAAMLDSILTASRRNNRRDELTGLLVVGGRRFLQLLEGPPQVLDRAYERIRADDRHFALVQLTRKPVVERCFSNWEMGFEQLGDVPLAKMVERLTERVSDPSLRAQFRGFAEIHGKAA
jgi:hypothetical protein